MASRTLPGLGLQGFWTLGEAWKAGGDTNWLTLSVMAQLVVESATANLPASPANGVVYIVNPAGGGLAGRVAVRDSGAWVYLVPPLGTQAWVKDAVGTDKRFRYDGTTWVAERPAATPAREQLTAARTYYVRADGNDSNTGLLNTAAGAFLTIQKAVDTAAAIDLSIYDITINIAAGTWTVPVVLKSLVGAGKVVIRGINNNMTSTIVNVSGSAFSGGFDGTYDLQYMKIQATMYGMAAGPGGGSIKFSNIDFGSAAEQINTGFGGFIEATGNYTISGDAGSHIGAYDGGHIRVQTKTVTLSGTRSFTAFAGAARGGTVLINGNSFSGSATGKRFDAKLAGGILTLGATLPGNAAGTATSPGWSE